MATLQLSAGNSTFVQVVLTNAVDDSFINDSTVTGRIDNVDDTEAVPNFSMPYVAASDGLYRATLPPDVDIVDGQYYKVIIDSLGSDSLVGHWVCTTQATAANGC